jgi:TPR repeat protein
MYANGNGVPKDAIEGLAWINIAAASGVESFIKNRDILERRLGTEATLAAQQRSKQILKEIEAAKLAPAAANYPKSHS